MYLQADIEKMNFKELRVAVSELNDDLIKLKRLIEDGLSNIDEDSLSGTLKNKLSGYESQINTAADKIEATVKYEDLEEKLKQYSTISQTAHSINATVTESREYTDGATQSLSSEFTMTADKIGTRVNKLKKDVEGNYTEMETRFEQTAEKIETLAFKKTDASFNKSTMPTKDNTTDAQKEKICVYNGNKYYYNSITQTWREYDEDEGVHSAFSQTADGFRLNGCVKVSGDLISEGTITGTDISGGKFWGEGSDNTQNQYFKISSSFGDIGVFDKDASSAATVKSSSCAWGIYFPDPSSKTFYMYSYGRAILGYNHSQKKLYPMGTWDFSSCNVIGLEDIEDKIDDLQSQINALGKSE